MLQTDTVQIETEVNSVQLNLKELAYPSFEAFEASAPYKQVVDEVTARYPEDTPEFFGELRGRLLELWAWTHAEIIKQLTPTDRPPG